MNNGRCARSYNSNNGGFTLIELLIVVAIIAILVAIALPMFLTAQLRAKAVRAHADMRTLATGLELYFVDYNIFPRGNRYQQSTRIPLPPLVPDRGLILLSTPVAYITRGLLPDPFEALYFQSYGGNPQPSQDPEGFVYYGYSGRGERGTIETEGPPDYRPGTSPSMWYVLQSAGPDRIRYTLGGGVLTYGDEQDFRDILYDPTNGVVSRGSLFRAGGCKVGPGTFAFDLIARDQ